MAAIQSYVEQFDPSYKSVIHLQTRLDKLIQCMSNYDAVKGEIVEHNNVTSEMLYDRTTVDDLFCTLKAQMLDLIEGHNKEPANSSITQTLTVIRDTMKLRFIPAPMFNGNLQN